ncbi:MAG: N-acetyl sugar amidotransferase, partial [Candidatus Margulisbacteria bacterium]|nr:N-acetyl sugar amidotransferase [Candidatus Margulisiibacteriota bacterium]
MNNNSIKFCASCVISSKYPEVYFNEKGICNYCTDWLNTWGKISKYSEEKIENIISKFCGKTKPYDCVVGLSGGKDSCYAVYIAKKLGLSPIT